MDKISQAFKGAAASACNAHPRKFSCLLRVFRLQVEDLYDRMDQRFSQGTWTLGNPSEASGTLTATVDMLTYRGEKTALVPS